MIKHLCLFFTYSSIDLNEIWYATMTHWSAEAHANFCDFIKISFQTDLCSDAFKRISFKHGMMIDMTRLVCVCLRKDLFQAWYDTKYV